ncbi:MAG: AAA family ATPase [Elainellaceae cyanobacterium]
MLYIFSGLPGTGKSTLSSALAQQRHAFYLRIDTIEQAMRDTGITEIGPIGYAIAYKVALDNLRLGAEVVADSVNPLEITRATWRETAALAERPFVEIEIICSDLEEHRTRVESRLSNVTGLKLPTWNDVIEREYEPWTTERLVIDTAGRSPDQSIAALFESLHLIG